MTRIKTSPFVIFGGVAVMLATFSLLPEGKTLLGLSIDFWRGVMVGILIGVAVFGWSRASTSTD